jgi:hypothetical protein
MLQLCKKWLGWLKPGAQPKKAKVQLNLFAKAAAPAKGSFTGDSHYARAMNKFTTDPVNIERYLSGDNKREGLQKAAKRKWSELKPGSKDGKYKKGRLRCPQLPRRAHHCHRRCSRFGVL